MNTILVPTDFSETAKNAYRYALALAEENGAFVKVLNVYHPPIDDIEYQANNNEATVKRTLRMEHFLKLDERMEEDIQTQIMVDEEYTPGYAVDVIVEQSKLDDIDLIVMGTTGEGGLFNQVFGSISSIVAQEAACPVYLIPDNIDYKPLRNILYTSNFENEDADILREVANIARKHHAGMHLVHVDVTNKSIEYSIESKFVEQFFTDHSKAVEFRMASINNKNVWDGLNRYSDENDIDLIVLLTKKRGFWKSLFHRSMTKQMVFNAKYPMLIYHLDDE